MVRSIAVLGATGSIGRQTLDLVARYPGRFRAAVLTAHSQGEALFELVRAFRPQAAGLVEQPAELPEDVRFCDWYFGPDASQRALRAVRPDDALAAVVGIAGLPAVMTALEVCQRVLLANKEALVTGGELVTAEASRRGVALLPVDSEHSAIFQCLQGAGGNPVQRLILTASGGPFRTWNQSDMENASVAQALGHPTWRMGAKITVDCASMMNKGLEVIEARHLFDMPLEQIDVVVHPQSVVHSMVEFNDGAVLAQLGTPDMRTAIGYAMGYPERLPYGGERLNFAKMGALNFEPPDLRRFACLALARQALEAGGTATTTLNGANEEAVSAFLQGRICFGAIARVVDRTLQHTQTQPLCCVEQVYAADRAARELARRAIEIETERILNG